MSFQATIVFVPKGQVTVKSLLNKYHIINCCVSIEIRE